MIIDKNNKIKIGVIGLGYVGLPLAIEFGKKSFVVAYDKSATRVKELTSSINFIDSTFKVKEKYYCHPYGGFSSFNDDTVKLLKKNNISCSFNVESRDAKKNDIVDFLHALPRFDCNEFAYGKAISL